MTDKKHQSVTELSPYIKTNQVNSALGLLCLLTSIYGDSCPDEDTI